MLRDEFLISEILYFDTRSLIKFEIYMITFPISYKIHLSLCIVRVREIVSNINIQ